MVNESRAWRLLPKVTLALCALCVVLLAFVVVQNVQNQATAADQKALQERQDCAREIANEQSEVKDKLTLVTSRRDQVFIAALLTSLDDNAAAAPLIAELAVLNDQVDAADDRVTELRPSQVLVERRCPSVDS